jgi:hypothetical protein
VQTNVAALRRAREGRGVIATAQTRGITLTHALLALHDGAGEWTEVLETLVRRVRSTLCSPHHQDGEPDSRRYRLLIITHRELPFDRARGYAPVEVTSHDARTYRASCDLDQVHLTWSMRAPHSGVAALTALTEYAP